ncbi:hypothetical protein [Burkholderia territorii]|uniref:hypothetical protein n=1 Tax=Burkholderia territorii TaxID=1503055 RepID=UPI0018C71744|nr:hypothetical protein [Burkholderia territorii]
MAEIESAILIAFDESLGSADGRPAATMLTWIELFDHLSEGCKFLVAGIIAVFADKQYREKRQYSFRLTIGRGALSARRASLGSVNKGQERGTGRSSRVCISRGCHDNATRVDRKYPARGLCCIDNPEMPSACVMPPSARTFQFVPRRAELKDGAEAREHGAPQATSIGHGDGELPAARE